MKKISIPKIVTVLAVLAISTSAFAADTQVQDLSRVEVTGSRLAESVDAVTQPAYVVTRAEIERSGARNVQEVLTRVPGIGLERYCQAQTHSKTVTLRGLSQEVLLLVDGLPCMTSSYMAGASAFDLRTIPMEDIEKIEIVKGAGSAVYGSAAAGGVINIITRKGAEKSSANVKVETGTQGWFKGSTRGTVVTDNGLKATVGYTRTRETGAMAIDRYRAGIDHVDNFTADDYSVRFDKGVWSLMGDWGNFDSSYEYQGKLDGHEGKYARTALMYNDGTNIAKFYYNNDKKTYVGGWSPSEFYNYAYGATLNRRQELFGRNVIYGVDLRSETFEKTSLATNEKVSDYTRNGVAPYVETTLAIGAANLDLGLRYEHWSVDDADDIDELIPRISLSYETNGGKLLYATAGRFFMMPSFFMTSYCSPASLWGPELLASVNLKPEKGWTYDIGIKDAHAKNPWSFGIFYMTMDDKIMYNSSAVTAAPAYVNVAEYRAYGFEGEYTYNINDAWSIKPGISYIHPEEKANEGSEWTRSGMPRWDASTYVNYARGEWAAELGMHYYADRELKSTKYDDDNIFITDASVTWTPEEMPGNVFRLACTNLFDKEYTLSDSWGTSYITPERRIVFTFEHNF